MRVNLLLFKLLAVSMCFRFSYLNVPSTLLPAASCLALAFIAFLVCPRCIVFDSSFFVVVSLALAYIFFVSIFADVSLVGFFKVSACFCAYILGRNLLKSKSEFFHDALPFLFKINIAFLFFEALSRYAWGRLVVDSSRSFTALTDVDSFLGGAFYQFKVGSFFFGDSNFASLHAFFLLILLVSTSQSKIYFKSYFVFLILLIFSTLSRSVISLSLFYSLFSLDYFSCNSFLRFLRLSLLVVFSLVFIAFFANLYFSGDFSLLTKFDVLHNFFTSSVSVRDLLFGIGFDKGIYLYGFGPGLSSHSLIPSLAGTVGIVGLSLYFFYLFACCSGFRPSALGSFVILFILGFSLFDPFEPLFFFVSGISAAFNPNLIFNSSIKFTPPLQSMHDVSSPPVRF
jgi:hypothetical protein